MRLAPVAVESMLEAAHIYPRKGEQTSEAWNSLPLRTKLHTRDVFLMTVEAESLQWARATLIGQLRLRDVDGRQLAVPTALAIVGNERH